MTRTVLASLPATDATTGDALYDVWVSCDGSTYGDFAYGCSYADLVVQLDYAEADASIVAVRVDRWIWDTGEAPVRTSFGGAR